MKKKILSLCCCLLGIGATTVFAQQSVNAGGGNATGTGGTVSYSIGQVFYATPSNSTHSIVQGVQQPYEISVLNAVEEKSEAIKLAASVYPNPTEDNFTLRVEISKLKNVSYELYNFQGQLLATKKIDTDETLVDVSTLNASYYILKVYEGNQAVKTFKISKY